MKKIFFSSAYNIRHSEINEQNVLDKLKDDIRSRMLGDVKWFVYGKRGPLLINPDFFYVGGFYFEKEDPAFTPCENVVNRELEEIEEADIVIASLLKYSSVATVTEIVYAARFPEKDIIIFCDPDITWFEIPYEYWFPILINVHMNARVRIIYVKSEEEILDYVKEYGKSPASRIIVEGTDGIGKTTVVRRLREWGIDCLDREKTTISACVFPEIPVWKRAEIWQNYLQVHPNDVLAVLTMMNKNELMKRIEQRGSLMDDFDLQAPLYDDLYRETVGFMKKMDLLPAGFCCFKWMAKARQKQPVQYW